MVNHQDETTTWKHGFNDIYIPVPYDPEIPGVRCVDADAYEEVEKVDVAMENTLSDDGGEDIELQDLGQGDDLGDVGVLEPLLSIEDEPPVEDKLQTGDIQDLV